MQIQVFRGAPALLYRIIKPANSLDINPTKVKRRRSGELSAREDLCVSHSILQLSKVSDGNTGLHIKEYFFRTCFEKPFNIFAMQAKSSQ